ncbi:MAG: hypothetical protein MRZ45_02105, partial [Blautia sp.]|nr:hypothetical protein [Blautia sp.]
IITVHFVTSYYNTLMLGSKAFDPMMPSDFSALRAPKIRKTFEIRSFSFEKWLLSHVLRDP